MESISELKDLCWKKDKEIFFLDKYFFRPISIIFTKIFLLMKASANGVTFLSLVCALSSCLFLTMDGKLPLLAAAILIFLYRTFDDSDGEVARYYIKKKGAVPSLGGEYFDFLVHFFSTNLMFFFMGLGLYLRHGYLWVLLLGFICCIGLANFPNFCCSLILMQALYRVQGMEDKTRLSEKLLAELRGISNIEASKVLNSGTAKQRAFAFIKELLIFPGSMIFMPLVCILDIIFAPFNISGTVFTFRTLYLLFFAVLMIFNTVRKSMVCLQRLSRIEF